MTKPEGERLAVVEEQIKNIDKKIDEQCKDLHEFKRELWGKIKEIKDDFGVLDVKYDHRYASKITEIIVYGMAGMVLAGFLATLIRFAW